MGGGIDVTHTLHRLRMNRGPEGGAGDYIVMVMAAQGFNETGSEERFRRVLRILADHDPVNLADDNQGSIHTGETVDALEANVKDTAYISAVFNDRGALLEVLRELAGADLGLSVVVTGDPADTWPTIREAGLDIHTVNLSLGSCGASEELPSEPVLALVSMCGHGLVSPAFAGDILRKVREGLLDARGGALELASVCTCGMFNVTLAEEILLSGEVQADACRP